jgi:uridine kinase
MAEIERLDGADALKWLRSHIRTRVGRTLVGIDGIPGAGKSDFADELAELLRVSGLTVVRVSMRDFVNMKAVREAKGEDTGEGYYQNYFNLPEFIADVVEPLRNDGSGRYLTKYYDADAECGCDRKWSIAPDDSVVIVDGVFLHRPEFCSESGKKVWDFSVWLDVPFVEAFRRLAGSQGLDPDPMAPSNARYFSSAGLYIERCDPAVRADVVVDNAEQHHLDD